MCFQVRRFDRRREGETAKLVQGGAKIRQTGEHGTRQVNASGWAFSNEFTFEILEIFVSRDNSDSDDDVDVNEPDAYASLDSVPSDNSYTGVVAPSEPPSLTESMLMMDEILSDKTMDRSQRIDKLEAILSAASLLQSDQVIHTGFFFQEIYQFYICSFQIITSSSSFDAVDNNNLGSEDLSYRLVSIYFYSRNPK